MRPDIRQVAAEAGVSTATVSRVLSGKGPASPGAVERVRAVAERLRYSPSASASSLRTDRSKIIAVLVPNLANPVFLPFIRAVEHRAQAHGYAVLVADTQRSPEVERRQLERLAAQRVDGVLVVGRPPDDEVLGPLVDSGTPILDTESFGAVQGGRDRWLAPAIDEACAHLAEFGHERVALMVGGGTPGPSGGHRRRLIEASCRRRGLELQMVPMGAAGDPVHPDPIRMAEDLERLVRTPGGPTALWAGSHPATPLLLEGLARADIGLPDEVSFLTFGDSPWAAAYRPGISVISGDLASVAEPMTVTVLHRLGVIGPADDDDMVEPYRYLPRASVGPVRRDSA